MIYITYFKKLTFSYFEYKNKITLIMFRLALEGYLLMFFTLLHFTVLTCDESCLLPVLMIRRFLPAALIDFAMSFLHVFGIEYSTAQFIGQFMVIGDIFIFALFIIKVFGAILKRFLLMFTSLILTIIALQRVNLI